MRNFIINIQISDPTDEEIFIERAIDVATSQEVDGNILASMISERIPPIIKEIGGDVQYRRYEEDDTGGWIPAL